MTNNENNNYKEGVSVVIVTYNGSKLLLPTLTHLAKQQDINFDFEILLIDNNSNDGTSKKVIEMWKDLGSPFQLRVILEPKPGTMYARKRGIEESSYRYILYCDDDNWLCSDYVSIAYNLIKNKSLIAAVGGRGIMEYEHGFEAPNWFAPYEINYGTGAQGKQDGDTTNDKRCLYTAGAIIDKQWLSKLYNMGFKSALKGRNGKSLVAGEDTELTYALRLIGGKLYYSSKMEFKHYMPSSRIQWSYLKRLWFAFGIADYIISPYNNYYSKKKDYSYLKMLFINLKTILGLTIKLTLNKKKLGDKRKLFLEMRKGELKSMLFYRKECKETKKILAHLTKCNPPS